MRKQIIAIYDDHDGRIIEADVQTRQLPIAGQTVTVDLSPASVAKLDELLAAFVSYGYPNILRPVEPTVEALPEALPEPEPQPEATAEPEPEPQPQPEPEPQPARVKAFRLSGKRVREFREAKGWGQNELAKRLSATTSQSWAQTKISILERNRRVVPLPLPEVNALARVLGVALADLDTPDAERPAEEAPAEEAPAAPVKVFECDQPGCSYKESRPSVFKGHQRLKHGIGGKSSKQMNEEWRAQQEGARREEIKASILDPMKTERPTPTPAALGGTITRIKPIHTIEPGVNIVTHERPAPAPPREGRVLVPARSFGETTVELDLKVTEYADKFKHGLPDDIPFEYHSDVLALEGMDPEIAEAALRNPEWVEVAVQTFKKGYPILRFHRGDATTILGLRNPAQPAIIAVYHGSLLMHDIHRVTHTSGGGGKQVDKGLPKTANEMIRRLRAMGAEIEYEETMDVTAVPVTFKGQDLGKISVGNVQRSDVEVAYQRTVRKMAAITKREESAATG